MNNKTKDDIDKLVNIIIKDDVSEEEMGGLNKIIESLKIEHIKCEDGTKVYGFVDINEIKGLKDIISFHNGYREALNDVLEMIDSIIFNIDTSLMHGKQATAIISQLQQLQQEIRDKKSSLQ
jgi:hypothetical protein